MWICSHKVNLQRGKAASPPPCLSPGGSLGASWGRPGGVLGASWGRLGVVLGVLGRLGSVCGGGPLKIRFSFRNSPLLGGVLGRPGGVLGASWGRLGAVLGRLGASWEDLRGVWGRLGSVLERLGHLQASKIEKSLKNQRKTIKKHPKINLI